MKPILILLAAALVVALPFLFRRDAPAGDWAPGDPVLSVVSPHNEAIRQEFAAAFSDWHRRRYGRPARIDWRAIGGTTEIMRYLDSEYAASARRFFRARPEGWPADGTEAILAPARPSAGPEAALWSRFRATDDPAAFSCGLDVFFGGGSFDHSRAERQGLIVPAWGTNAPPAGLFADADGRTLIPAGLSGETWRGRAFYGTALSAFGICYNLDRLRDFGIPHPPRSWEDLADPRYNRGVGMIDPSKSGSAAKAIEMAIHARMAREVAAAGFPRERILRLERAGKPFPPDYEAAIGRGWRAGVNLIRRIGANALYFSDASGKVPVDASLGAIAAGIAIDFSGRFQAELSTPPGRAPVMGYATPRAGSSVTADPISLLRGAPHRELAVRFIEFVLGEDGQKLWAFRPGTPGGPRRFALRRLPIRRDFYPSPDPALNARYESRRAFTSDDLGDPAIDAYSLGEAFLYVPRWTAAHYGIQRDLVRAMCMDSGEELHAAWRAILDRGGPDRNPEAMALLEALPDSPYPLTWQSAVAEYAAVPRLRLLREWTAFFRRQYRLAAKAAGRSPQPKGPRHD